MIWWWILGIFYVWKSWFESFGVQRLGRFWSPFRNWGNQQKSWLVEAAISLHNECRDGKPALMDEFEIQKTTHFSSLESLSTNQWIWMGFRRLVLFFYFPTPWLILSLTCSIDFSDVFAMNFLCSRDSEIIAWYMGPRIESKSLFFDMIVFLW